MQMILSAIAKPPGQPAAIFTPNRQRRKHNTTIPLTWPGALLVLPAHVNRAGPERAAALTDDPSLRRTSVKQPIAA